MGEVVRAFRIVGKVQGVYFRHGTRQEAQRLGVTGLARNLPDGSVQVFAKGSVAALEALCAWLQHGPPQARVDAVHDLNADAAAGTPFADFEVL